jgi:hypothetical protein
VIDGSVELVVIERIGRRVLDHHVEHEAVELRLGQRIRAFLLDRILRREHEERTLEIVAHARDRDLVFLHRLEQRRLRLRRRAVDLVGEDDVGEDRAANETDDPFAGGAILLDHLGAEDVGRHQVGRELDAVEAQVHGIGERLDQQRLRQPGNAAQQAMPAGEKCGEDLADDALLPDDRFRQLALEPCGHLGHTIDRRGRNVSFHPGRVYTSGWPWRRNPSGSHFPPSRSTPPVSRLTRRPCATSSTSSSMRIAR